MSLRRERNLASDEVSAASLVPTLRFDTRIAREIVDTGLIVWAAARRAWPAIPVLAGLGFDVNARARVDVPMEQEWETELHEAAAAGEVAAARQLIELGADPASATLVSTRLRRAGPSISASGPPPTTCAR